MKKIIALTLLLSSVNVLAEENLISNSGFETGDLSSWTVSGWLTYSGVSAGNANSGTYSMIYGNPYSNYSTDLSQTLTTHAGQPTNYLFI